MAFQDTAHLLVEPRNEVGEADVRGPVPTIKVGIDSLGMIVAAPRRAKAGPGGGGEGCSGQAGEVGIGNRRCDSGTRRGHDVHDGSGGSRGHHEHEDDCHRRRPPTGSHRPHRSRSGGAARGRLAGRRSGTHGTVGGYIRANAGRGAVAGLNGDFFLLARNVPSGNLLIHKGRSFLGGTNRGAAAFGADGSVEIVPGNVKDADLVQRGVREAISGKPVYVHDGRLGDLTTLEPYQRDAAYHRTAVGRLRNGQTALVVIGGAGTTASQFAQALLGLGFVEALGMDIDSSANVNWRGASLNRPDYQRQIPTGIIAFRRVG